MFANTLNKQDPQVEFIFHHLQTYNQDKPQTEQINFLHGGSSAVLSMIGKSLALTYHDALSTPLPAALIPTGRLICSVWSLS